MYSKDIFQLIFYPERTLYANIYFIDLNAVTYACFYLISPSFKAGIKFK